MSTTNVYILKLSQNKWYVGKSKLPQQRILHHFQQQGSLWTKKYHPLDVVEIRENCDQFDEDKITKEYMAKYGIDNVRGGSYVAISLPDYQWRALQTELNSADDACFKCGRRGHFVKDCRSRFYKARTTCFRCGRYGHFAKNCYAKTHIDGNIFEPNNKSDDDSSDDSGPKKDNKSDGKSFITKICSGFVSLVKKIF